MRARVSEPAIQVSDSMACRAQRTRADGSKTERYVPSDYHLHLNRLTSKNGMLETFVSCVQLMSLPVVGSSAKQRPILLTEKVIHVTVFMRLPRNSPSIPRTRTWLEPLTAPPFEKH